MTRSTAWSQTTPEERAELLRGRGRRAQAAHPRLRPARDRGDGLHRQRREADAGAAGARCASSATPGARSSRRSSRCRPRRCRPPRSRPAGSWARMARRAPVGVVACITPYNFPIVNMAGKIAPALAMGNTVVVRPASQDPLAVIDLVQAPPRRRVPARRRQRRHRLDARPRARRWSSRPTSTWSASPAPPGSGCSIGEVGGRTMKRLLLELGGKGAALVFDDADLKTDDRHDRLGVDLPLRPDLHRADTGDRAPLRSTTRWSRGWPKMATVLKVGDPLEQGTVVGPLITAAHRDRVEGYIAVGQGRGRRGRRRRRTARAPRQGLLRRADAHRRAAGPGCGSCRRRSSAR